MTLIVIMSKKKEILLSGKEDSLVFSLVSKLSTLLPSD